jgi:hypothetical protein
MTIRSAKPAITAVCISESFSGSAQRRKELDRKALFSIAQTITRVATSHNIKVDIAVTHYLDY